MFLEKQWAVLSPVLELEPGKVIDIPLEPQCALPFRCEEEAASRFSVVYKAELHPSHCVSSLWDTGPLCLQDPDVAT